MHTGASCPILYYYNTIMQQCVTSKVCVGMFGWNSVKKWYSTILAWSSGLFSQINPFQVVYSIYYWLVMERTWVRVRNVRLFWSSSSFSSTFGLKSKVRDVRSSEMPKFVCSKFEFLEFVPFRSILGQIYCIETEKFYNFSPT